ncbi:hypothetical protein BDD12DRAFT_810888 [Trichophaea hybrida]|nr:hypothetical protein BDD12DRAFT_810888 [Trichophaea hybrida]
MKFHPHRVLIGAVLAVIVRAAPQDMPSPSSYPRIATSTVPSDFRSIIDMQPTPIPELRKQLKRQASDSLGWNDPLTCNVGVCLSDGTCTVFASDGLRASTATGVCCAISAQCEPGTVCVEYSSHRLTSVASYSMVDGSWLCGSTQPYCSSIYFQYGWGLGTFLYMACGSGSAVRSTSRNSSWKLYATETNPAKGPMPSETLSAVTSKDTPSTTVTPSPPPRTTSSIQSPSSLTGKSKIIPVGGIAGICRGNNGSLVQAPKVRPGGTASFSLSTAAGVADGVLEWNPLLLDYQVSRTSFAW